MGQLNKEFTVLRREYIKNRFSHLNPQQVEAVMTVRGPLLILSGAGSGKTTVVVNRIANLVEFGTASEEDDICRDVTAEETDLLRKCVQDDIPIPESLKPLMRAGSVHPYNILAITFTNKAANELKSRIGRLGASGEGEVWASTFHSACVRILRSHADLLGYDRSFTIYDTDDQKRMMKSVYKALEIDDKIFPINHTISQIGRLKDEMTSCEEFERTANELREQYIARIYSAYTLRMRECSAMDFDDLIFNTVRLFEDFPEVLDRYRRLFKFIHVDEYQDTSYAQFRLVELLAGKDGNICVVGDDDQSIYAFRGAVIENILSFDKHFKDAKTIRLEQNYRSTQKILTAANSVIENNTGRKGKTLWTENKEGDNVCFYLADDENDEAAYLALEIGTNVTKGAKLSQHVVLYRTNAQSNPVELYFRRAGIQYEVISGHKFFDRKEVKDILAYVCAIQNPRDNVRFMRIINEPARGIGGVTAQALGAVAARENKGYLEVLYECEKYPELAKHLKPLLNARDMFLSMRSAREEMPIYKYFEYVMERSGYMRYLESLPEEGTDRIENLGQLVSGVKIFERDTDNPTIDQYLEQVALISDIDRYNESDDKVVLMTLHSAKGLEFDYVFIIGMEDGLFPNERCMYNAAELEEERRLAYVGITRAKKRLYLSAAESRMIFGMTRRNRVSRFVKEIGGLTPDDRPTAAGERYRSPTAVYRGSPSTTSSIQKAKIDIKSGDKVKHKVFGNGMVVSTREVGNDVMVEIVFESAGKKVVMLQYAPIEKL